MSLTGNLEDLPLLDILQIVSFSKKTGYLSIRTAAGEGAVPPGRGPGGRRRGAGGRHCPGARGVPARRSRGRRAAAPASSPRRPAPASSRFAASIGSPGPLPVVVRLHYPRGLRVAGREG